MNIGRILIPILIWSIYITVSYEKTKHRSITAWTLLSLAAIWTAARPAETRPW